MIKLYNNNCTDILPKLSNIDLVVTSPPYDNLRDYNKLTWNFGIFKTIAKQLYDCLKEGGVVVWIVGDQVIDGSESGTSFKQALYFKEIGFRLHDTMIWEKPNFSNPSSNRYHQIFEYMFIFSKGKLNTFNPIKDRKNSYTSFIRGEIFGKNTSRSKNGEMIVRSKNKIDEYGQRNNIWKINTSGQENPCQAIEHPATFSEQIAKDHIVSWSNTGDIVLDLFMGSGTTGAIAKALGRSFIGIEIFKDYFEFAEKRINETKEQMKLFV